MRKTMVEELQGKELDELPKTAVVAISPATAVYGQAQTSHPKGNGSISWLNGDRHIAVSGVTWLNAPRHNAGPSLISRI
jgi:hypothetical protein